MRWCIVEGCRWGFTTTLSRTQARTDADGRLSDCGSNYWTGARLLGQASVCFILSAIFSGRWKYTSAPTDMYWWAGHLGQNLYLAATSLGLPVRLGLLMTRLMTCWDWTDRRKQRSTSSLWAGSNMITIGYVPLPERVVIKCKLRIGLQDCAGCSSAIRPAVPIALAD